MANCKYCHAALTRIDKEVCPFCGGLKPLEGTDTSTQDVTKVIDQLENPVKIRHAKRVVACILAILLGFLGVHSLYVAKFKKALITFLISLGLIGGLGSIIFFAIGWHSVFAFLIPYFVIEVVMILIGVGYLTRHDIVDGHGEFLD